MFIKISLCQKGDLFLNKALKIVIMKVIAVSGTTGAGKTTFSKKLAKEKGYEHINVNEFVKENKLYDHYDRASKSYVVDEKKLISLVGLIYISGCSFRYL